MTHEQRIKRALEYAVQYGGTDGAHHLRWVIDQMVRALTGCPLEDDMQGESEEYLALVADAKNGDDGPETYDWDEGMAP